MNSGFISFENVSSLGDSFTADQIVGNRFKILKDVTAFVSYPGNSETEQWSQGTYTPVVNSWVTREDGVYWQFGEMTPYRYVKHDKEAFKIVPVTGGAQYLVKEEEKKNPLDVNDLLSFDMNQIIKDMKATLKIAVPVVVVAGIALYSFPLIAKKLVS